MTNLETLKAQIEYTTKQVSLLEYNIDTFEYECSEDEYDEMLDEVYGDVEVCGFTYSSSQALKELDPTAYRCGKSDYESEYDLNDCKEYTDMISDLEELKEKLEDLEEDLEQMESEED